MANGTSKAITAQRRGRAYPFSGAVDETVFLFAAFLEEAATLLGEDLLSLMLVDTDFFAIVILLRSTLSTRLINQFKLYESLNQK